MLLLHKQLLKSEKKHMRNMDVKAKEIWVGNFGKDLG